MYVAEIILEQLGGNRVDGLYMPWKMGDEMYG